MIIKKSVKILSLKRKQNGLLRIKEMLKRRKMTNIKFITCSSRSGRSFLTTVPSN